MKEILACAVLMVIYIPLENHGATIYYPTQTSATYLTQATKTEVFTSMNKRACAIEASRRPWCQLMCYKDHQCSIYDLLIGAYNEDNSQDAVEFCWSNVEGCVMENKIYQEGEIFNKICEPLLICRSRRWQPIARVKAYDHYVLGVGYLFFSDVRKTFEGARNCCHTIDGELIVASSHGFKNLVSYMKFKNIFEHYWVGVKDEKWLDGRGVTPEEWYINQPENVPPSCAWLVAMYDDYRLHDQTDCSLDYGLFYICQKN